MDIDDIDFAEVAMFCSDSLLSESAQKEKQEFIEKIEQEHPEFKTKSQDITYER